MDFFTCFTHEKTPQNNFSHQNFIVENNDFFCNFILVTFSLGAAGDISTKQTTANHLQKQCANCRFDSRQIK